MEHSFNVEIAKVYGAECAVILKHFDYWIIKNEADGTNLRDGKVWTFSSYKSLNEIIPYLSEHQIKRRVKELLDGGVLIVDSFNKSPFNRTNWYSIDRNKYNAILYNRSDGIVRSEGTDSSDGENKVAKCIEDISIEDISKDKSNLNINAETSSAPLEIDLFGNKNKPVVNAKKREYNGSEIYNPKEKDTHLHNYFKATYLQAFIDITGISDKWARESGAIAYGIIKIISEKSMEIRGVESMTKDEIKDEIDSFFYAVALLRGPYFLANFNLKTLYSNTVQVFVKIIDKNGNNFNKKQGQRPGVTGFRFDVPTP